MCPPEYWVKLLQFVSCFVLTTTSLNLDEGPIKEMRLGSTECLARNGTAEGYCLPHKYCNAEHEIAVYAVIHESELRETKTILTECPNDQWCCVFVNDDSEETNTPNFSNTQNSGTTCTLLDSTDCPWCVTLHKGTSDDRKETGLYCMGSMIGPKVILTSASCLLAAKNIKIWAQMPTSVNPKEKYSVSNKILHPNYNSGTHEFDYGLVILNDDVNWGQKNWKGACLGLETAVYGECIGFGFDEDDQIVSTLLISTPGGCSERGNTSDVVCSRKSIREKYCNIVSGSPVVCNGNGDVRGVARSSCSGDEALVGSLLLSKDWITTELKTLNVFPNEYINAS